MKKLEKMVIAEALYSTARGMCNWSKEIKRNKNYVSPFTSNKYEYLMNISKKVNKLWFADDFFKYLGVETKLNIDAPNAEEIDIIFHPAKQHEWRFGNYDYLAAEEISVKNKKVNFRIFPRDNAKDQLNLKKVEINTNTGSLAIHNQNKIEEITVNTIKDKLSKFPISINNCPNLKNIDLSNIKELDKVEIKIGDDINPTLKFNPKAIINIDTLERFAGLYGIETWFHGTQVLEKYKDGYAKYKSIPLNEILPVKNGKIEMSYGDFQKAVHKFMFNDLYNKEHIFWMIGNYANDRSQHKLADLVSPELLKEFRIWDKEQKELEAIRIEKLKKEEELKKKQLEAIRAKEAKEAKAKYKKWVDKQNQYQKKLIAACEKTQDRYGVVAKAYHKSDKFIKQWESIKSIKDAKKYVEAIMEAEVQKERDYWKNDPHREDGNIGACENLCECAKQEIFKELDKLIKVR